MKLKLVGQIGAGRVVPFTKQKKTVVVPVPSNIVALSPMVFTVCGDSFIDEGIKDGAVIIAREKFHASEVTPGRLCIVRIAGVDDLMKRVYVEGGNVLLRSGNPKYDDMIYSVEFVQILALVEAEHVPRK